MLDNRNLFKRFILCLGVAGSFEACSPTGFLAGKSPTPPTQSIAIETPKTNSNDRPTETGAGVPGYLVNCSEIVGASDQVQVGCSVANIEGARVKTEADAWNRYDVKLPTNANPAITVARNASTGIEAWDVLFVFRGADQTLLRAAAQSSTFTYTYTDAEGQTQKVQTATPTVSKTPATPSSPSCSGVIVENVCVVSVPISCTDYCNQSAMKVHSWVVDRYGTGSGNKSICAELYAQFPETDGLNLPISFATDILSGRGLGCHSTAGRVFFDLTPTDPSATPYIGYTRICACTN